MKAELGMKQMYAVFPLEVKDSPAWNSLKTRLSKRGLRLVIGFDVQSGPTFEALSDAGFRDGDKLLSDFMLSMAYVICEKCHTLTKVDFSTTKMTITPDVKSCPRGCGR